MKINSSLITLVKSNLIDLLKEGKGLLLFVIGGLILLFASWGISGMDEKSQPVQQTLASLCRHSPDDYWNLRAGILQSYPMASNASPLLAAASKVMKTAMARDDFDLARLVVTKGQRLEDTKPNAKLYIFQKDCQVQDGGSIAWRLAVLTTLGGGLEAIALKPFVSPEFYVLRHQLPNLDFFRSKEEAEAVLRNILPRGLPKSEAIEVMKRLGELGWYGKLVGPAYIEKGRAARYEYTFTRDIGVLPRVALEEIKLVIILELDVSDKIVNVKVP